MLKFKLLSLLRNILVVGLVMFMLPTRSVQAAGMVYRVKPGGLSSGACGDTWANSCSLQYALSLSQSGDELWVAAGTYKPTTSTDRVISFNLKRGVRVYGGFAGSETLRSQRDPVINTTILSGDIGVAGDSSDNSYHVVYGVSLGDNSVLNGFTIKAGNANGASPHNLGGGMYCYACTATLSRLIFVENYAALLGGGLYNKQSTLTLINVVFSQNSSGKDSGGHNNLRSTLILTNVSYTGNSALGRGGGLYNYESSATLTNTSFNNNSAQDIGGGLNNYSSVVQMIGATFTGNTAVRSGGGIYTSGGTLTLTDGLFTGNTVTSDATDSGGGGMMNSSNSLVTISNTTFDANHSADRAGGVYNYDSAGSMTNVIFSNNTAVERGGGMFNSASHPTLTAVTFTGNSSGLFGGAVDNNGSSPTFNQVTFTGNSSWRGGGVYNWEYSSPVFNEVSFNNNHATERGGGMYNVDYCNFTLNDSVFDGNTSVGDGAGMFISNSNPTINRTVFKNNITPAHGGGIYNSYTHATLNDVLFASNTALHGGGLDNNNSDPTLTNVTFNGNTAQKRGGGLYNYSSSPTLVNVTFANNTAGTYGGGSSNSAGSLQVSYVTFSDNAAGVDGGGMWLDGSTINIANSIFWGNTAVTSGAQIHTNHSGNPVIERSIIQSGCPSGAVCTEVITSDPMLGTLGDHGGVTPTIPTLPGSSAIDTGNDIACPSTDQRGITRPQGARCDIGAFETEIVDFSFSPTIGEKLTKSKVTFDWDDIYSADSYKIQLSTKSDFSVEVFKTTTAASAYAYLLPLQYNTQYYWRIRVLDNGVWSNWLPTWNFYSMDPLTAPVLNDPPNAALQYPDLTLSWTAVPNAVQYKLHVALDPAFTNLLFNSKVSDTFKSFTNLAPGKYYWRVRAFEAGGLKSPWSEVREFSVVKVFPPILSAPDHESLVSPDVTLTWQAAQYAVQYKLKVSTDPAFTTLLVNEKTTDLSKGLLGLAPGDYYWRVRAIDVDGFKSPWSQVRKFTVVTPP